MESFRNKQFINFKLHGVLSSVIKLSHLAPSHGALKLWVHPDHCGSGGWASSCKSEGHWFDSWSGHVTGLWGPSLVRECVRGNWSMFLSHIDVSLPPFLLPFFPPFPLL